MLGSNPSADSVASTDRGLKGDATRHPSFLFEELLIGKASILGGGVQAPVRFPLKSLKIATLAIWSRRG